jgi:hypothetical protein
MTNLFFTELVNSEVMLIHSGVYSIHTIFTYAGKLYVRVGKTRYIKLLQGGNTSTQARWFDLNLPKLHKELKP